MSPSLFNYGFNANEYIVNSTGSMDNWNTWNTIGVRHFPKKDIGINFRVRFCVSPSHFNNWFNANEIMVRDSGDFDNWDTNDWLGVRPFSKRVIGINLNVWWFIGVAV